MIVTAFLLGFLGSAGHCIGMCSGVTILLTRNGVGRGWRLLLAHSGRIVMYTLLGTLAGSLSFGVGQIADSSAHNMPAMTHPTGGSFFNFLQGGLVLSTAFVTIYMALALIGRLPAPEIYLVNFTRRWRSGMQQIGNNRFGLLTPFVAGLLWGLLPCGLVLTALLTAGVAGTPAQGAFVMMSFGAGTIPMLLVVTFLARSVRIAPSSWVRSATAMVVAVFGIQLAFRGFAAWGWVEHLHIGNMVVW